MLVLPYHFMNDVCMRDEKLTCRGREIQDVHDIQAMQADSINKGRQGKIVSSSLMKEEGCRTLRIQVGVPKSSSKGQKGAMAGVVGHWPRPLMGHV